MNPIFVASRTCRASDRGRRGPGGGAPRCDAAVPDVRLPGTAVSTAAGPGCVADTRRGSSTRGAPLLFRQLRPAPRFRVSIARAKKSWRIPRSSCSASVKSVASTSSPTFPRSSGLPGARLRVWGSAPRALWWRSPRLCHATVGAWGAVRCAQSAPASVSQSAGEGIAIRNCSQFFAIFSQFLRRSHLKESGGRIKSGARPAGAGQLVSAWGGLAAAPLFLRNFPAISRNFRQFFAIFPAIFHNWIAPPPPAPSPQSPLPLCSLSALLARRRRALWPVILLCAAASLRSICLEYKSALEPRELQYLQNMGDQQLTLEQIEAGTLGQCRGAWVGIVVCCLARSSTSPAVSAPPPPPPAVRQPPSSALAGLCAWRGTVCLCFLVVKESCKHSQLRSPSRSSELQDTGKETYKGLPLRQI